MKKKYVSRTIKILSFALAAFLIMTVTQVRGDHNKIRLDGFYMEEKNSLDVVLLGASEVYTAFSSALAYDEYGFTSYPYATEANYIDLFESQIKEIQSTQNPKLILVEMNGALYDNKMKDKDVKLRRMTDSMPFSQNKIDTINQFGDKDNVVTDMMFSNYNTGNGTLKNSAEYAKSMGRDPYDYYKGFDIQGRSLHASNANWNDLNDVEASVGFWGAHSQGLIHQSATDYGTSDVAIQQAYLDKQEMVFSGGNRNPANTPDILGRYDVVTLANGSLKAGSQGMTYGFEQNADGTYNTDMRFLFRGDTLTLIGEDNVEGDYPKVILGLTTLAGIWK